MAARLIDGRAVAARVRAEVARGVADHVAGGSAAPGLATVIVGDDEASQVYVAMKRRACEEAGIRSIHHELSEDVSQDELTELVDSLSRDDAVDGILMQLPLPDGLDQDRVLERLASAKDVDGLTPRSAGLLAQGKPGLVPCTPRGVLELLFSAGIEPAGSDAVIVGRSILVGRPLASLLMNADATVTVAHSRTRGLADVCRRADILVVAAGVRGLVDATCIKPGATVIDVGINRTEAGLVGDVDHESAAEVAGAITPVPGGVGPMTIAMLLSNTLEAARARAGR